MNKIKMMIAVVGMVVGSFANAGNLSAIADQQRACTSTANSAVMQAKIMRGELVTVPTIEAYDERIIQSMLTAGKDEAFIKSGLARLTSIRTTVKEIGLHHDNTDIHVGVWARCMDGDL